MKLFFLSIGLVFIMEGLPYFISPEKMKFFLSQIINLPENHLRTIGFASMVTGLGICYLASLLLQS